MRESRGKTFSEQDGPATHCLVSRRMALGWLGSALLTNSCHHETKLPPAPARTSGPLSHEGYVWQRVWTPQVHDGVTATRGKFSGLTVLAAEVDWQAGQPRLTLPKLDFALLATLEMPITLALRIGPWSGPFDLTDARTQQLQHWLKEVLASALSGGCQPVEVQIDFDAPTSKLVGYQTWLAAIQKIAAPLPVSFTALPDWLNSPILQAMAVQAGRFVLQVHAVLRAEVHPQAATLIDPAQALHWVERAAALGVPFRVALPTYRSVVGFNEAGKIVGIDSEGPRRAWPEGTRLVTYVSPPADLAALVRAWTADRPRSLVGLLWYRVPTPPERRNWTWPTLGSVMLGKTPLPDLHIFAQGENPVDLTLRNQGPADAAWPERIVASLPAGERLVAGDALPGYVLTLDPARPERAEWRLQADWPETFLAPGEEKSLGWLRLDATATHHDLTLTLP